MAERFAGVLGRSPIERAGSPPQPQTQLMVNEPGDAFEQEAERVSAAVIGAEGERSAAPGGHAFDRVRVHTDERAAESARGVQARAYTVGQEIVFGRGQFAPGTAEGQRLLAHELTHTAQQASGMHAMLMRAWSPATAECKDLVAADKWIETVVVNQETPQKVTLKWSDGSEESDQCSTGKGHCCVDSSNPAGVACSEFESRLYGTNCTPITKGKGLPVKNRVVDHGGVFFWTEFEPDRAIALHKYSPVDGTPLSHGCVRLSEDTAKKIFCNVRQERTYVRVEGFARPMCDNSNLQSEWTDDFATGGRDLSKADGEDRREILEIRRELNAAFGRTLTVDEIQKLTVADIPRCKKTAPLPKPAGGSAATGGAGGE